MSGLYSSGGLSDMSERQILYRLVGDVEALKRDMENGVKSRELTREKVSETEVTVHEINRKLDQFIGNWERQETRLKAVEEGVEDYRRTKIKAISIMTGIGLGGGGVGGFLGAMMAKMFGNGQ